MSKIYRRDVLKAIVAGTAVLVSRDALALGGHWARRTASGSGGVTNDIGTPGGAGFGVGVAPVVPTGFSVLAGTTTPGHDNYGNYQYQDGSVMCWVPAFYYRIGHVDNPTYAAYGANAVDVLPESAFADVAAANAAGYALHRSFVDGGAVKRGVMVDKYLCSKNALGSGYIGSSIKNGLPISCSSAHNPILEPVPTLSTAWLTVRMRETA